jgi:hypothetical protein
MHVGVSTPLFTSCSAEATLALCTDNTREAGVIAGAMSVIQLVVIHAERLLVFSPPTVVNCRSFRANLVFGRPVPLVIGLLDIVRVLRVLRALDADRSERGTARLESDVGTDGAGVGLPGAGDEARRPEEAVHGHRNPEGKCVEEVEVSAAA